MKLYRVILPVGNIDAAEQFYSAILGISGQRISPGSHYFDLKGTILACYDPKADDGEIEPVWNHITNNTCI
jgi:catechol 2,3-dioxygenase-like lactoylglutathione lyase family enzyme